jgi:hypothetical protein
MSNRVTITVASLALIAGLGSASGCRSAAAGLAGAAAIVTNDQNAEAEIAGSFTEVDGRAKRVLRDLGLLMVDAAAEDKATEFEYEARNGDRVVHVKLERISDTVTKVAVSSRLGTTLNYYVSHSRMEQERIKQLR